MGPPAAQYASPRYGLLPWSQIWADPEGHQTYKILVCKIVDLVPDRVPGFYSRKHHRASLHVNKRKAV